MISPIKRSPAVQIIIGAVCYMFCSIIFVSAGICAEVPVSLASPASPAVPGERIYREGVLPSGERIRASIQEGQAVPGTTFACVSCHLRSGLGSLDEGVYTPPINGAKLFKPLARLYKGIEKNDNTSPFPLRPAYTEQTLIEAIKNGINPAGRELHQGMPRYNLEESDARLLASYLTSLSAEFSPGVSDTNIRFATVIAEDVPAEKSGAMLSAFNYYFNMQNNQIKTFDKNPKFRLMAQKMAGRDLSAKSLTLESWTLKGPPDSWRRQLDEYYRNGPVFALVGGMVNGKWDPIHNFCEENGIPCLFPNTDLPVVSDSGWYTMYLSKGYYQEGESAALYLNDNDDLFRKGAVVQIVRSSPEAHALSDGFAHTWNNLGRQNLITVPLPAGKNLDGDTLKRIIAKEKPAVLVIWDDATALKSVTSQEDLKSGPEILFFSARYLGKSVWSLQESIRDRTYLTYPFVFSPFVAKSTMWFQKVQNDKPQNLRQADIPLDDEVKQIGSLTGVLTQQLFAMLAEMKGNYYRDNLLDVAGMMADQQFPLYGRISYDTDQRYASNGAFVVQLTRGDNPELIKKSDWLTR